MACRQSSLHQPIGGAGKAQVACRRVTGGVEDARCAPGAVRGELDAFAGGDDLDVLYVVSATRFLEPGEAGQQPLAGALFAIHDTGARGIPEPYFNG